MLKYTANYLIIGPTCFGPPGQSSFIVLLLMSRQ